MPLVLVHNSDISAITLSHQKKQNYFNIPLFYPKFIYIFVNETKKK